jgi:hypothetical protein
MATAALVLDAILKGTGVSISTYFGAITLYSMICGAYIGNRVAFEDEPKPAHRVGRRSRKNTQ